MLLDGEKQILEEISKHGHIGKVGEEYAELRVATSGG